MNASQVGASVGATQPITTAQPSADVKRAALQAMILKKSLESQQSQADAMSREAEGKGNRIDIRV
jgi:hypothetical protein